MPRRRCVVCGGDRRSSGVNAVRPWSETAETVVIESDSGSTGRLQSKNGRRGSRLTGWQMMNEGAEESPLLSNSRLDGMDVRGDVITIIEKKLNNKLTGGPRIR